MAVELLFPNFVFHRHLLDPNLSDRQGVSPEYLQSLKDEMDAMKVQR